MSIDGEFKLLDLCCGEGLAAWGYWLSGRFSHITGVDVQDMRGRYAFDFVQADFQTLDYDFLLQFDFIHVSPPCQAYSKMTPKASRGQHLKLIAAAHLICVAAGKPYVIENVEGSGAELRPNLVINGFYVDLPIKRNRYFHVSRLAALHQLTKMSSSPAANVHGPFVPRSELVESFGLKCIPEKQRNRLTVRGIEQGIPPAFTKHIAELVIPDKFYIG